MPVHYRRFADSLGNIPRILLSKNPRDFSTDYDGRPFQARQGFAIRPDLNIHERQMVAVCLSGVEARQHAASNSAVHAGEPSIVLRLRFGILLSRINERSYQNQLSRSFPLFAPETRRPRSGFSLVCHGSGRDCRHRKCPRGTPNAGPTSAAACGLGMVALIDKQCPGISIRDVPCRNSPRAPVMALSGWLRGSGRMW